MLAAYLAATAAQVSPTPPPAPPPAPLPGTPMFERDLDRYRADLRQACMSDAGIRIAVAHRTRLRQNSAVGDAERRAATLAVAEAALAPAIDVDRLAAAIRRQTETREQDTRRYDAYIIALMRELSPADRIAFAPRITVLGPDTPRQVCR